MVVNLRMMPLKIHYFLHGAGGAPVSPFLPVIARQSGMTGSGMGVILLFIQVLGLFFKPLIGGYMDKYQMKKRIFQGLVMGSIFGFYALSLVPAIELPELSLDSRCYEKESVKNELILSPKIKDNCLADKFHNLYYKKEVNCEFECTVTEGTDIAALTQGGRRGGGLITTGSDTPTFKFLNSFVGSEVYYRHGRLRLKLNDRSTPCLTGMKCFANCTGEDGIVRRVINVNDSTKIYGSLQYWLLASLWIFGALSFALVATFQDAICHQIVDEELRTESYGNQRLWASMGWGLSAFSVGYLVDLNSQNSFFYNYDIAFNVMFFCLFIDILVVEKMKIPETGTFASQNPFMAVGVLLKDKTVIVFLIYVAVVGFCYGALNVHFLLLEDLSLRSDCNINHALKTLQGIILFFNCVGEVPIFYYSGRIINHYGSKILMHVVLLIFGIRYLYYSWIVSPWATVLFEPFHGLCTGLFWPTLTTFVNQIAPQGSSTTMMALAFAVFDGIGMASGGLVASRMFDAIGGSATFGFFSVFAFIGLVAHVVAQNGYVDIDTAATFSILPSKKVVKT